MTHFDAAFYPAFKNIRCTTFYTRVIDRGSPINTVTCYHITVQLCYRPPPHSNLTVVCLPSFHIYHLVHVILFTNGTIVSPLQKYRSNGFLSQHSVDRGEAASVLDLQCRSYVNTWCPVSAASALETLNRQFKPCL
ncbi:hypothetical protein Bbelb_128580 [Branchiostoma belcheri]|nr:hypothetical protein Bbelb_128580 [Branchiostoma belcheri]